MPKLYVKHTFLYDNESDKNFAFINPSDHHLFSGNQLKIINKHGEHIFDKGLYNLVPSGYIALTRQQQQKYHLKKRHCYEVLPHTSKSSSISIMSCFNGKFDYRERVGGADDVFETIFGDVLISRLYRKSFCTRIGLTLPRGFILYGPSGTGKTLIAQTVANLLNVTPKIVSGLELYHQSFNESLTLVRSLFEVADFDQEKYGVESPLHVIIFDEMDTICKRRPTGNSSEYNTFDDLITRQIITEIDERKYLSNILIIGTTNAIELVNPAIYRSGRLDTLIEVKLPNAKGRFEIFDIHTKILSKNKFLSEDINIGHLIHRTDGMTGADIELLVHRAVNAAIERDVLDHGTLSISEEHVHTLQIKNIDFTVALARLQNQNSKHTAF